MPVGPPRVDRNRPRHPFRSSGNLARKILGRRIGADLFCRRFGRSAESPREGRPRQNVFHPKRFLRSWQFRDRAVLQQRFKFRNNPRISRGEGDCRFLYRSGSGPNDLLGCAAFAIFVRAENLQRLVCIARIEQFAIDNEPPWPGPRNRAAGPDDPSPGEQTVARVVLFKRLPPMQLQPAPARAAD